MNNYIYENNDDETLNNILFEIKRHILKEDIFSPYMEKETFLYNHPSLNAISEYAIKTDTFNFINADYFKKLSKLPQDWCIKLKQINDLDNFLYQETLDELENDDIGNEANDEAFTKMQEYQREIKELIHELPNIKIFNSLANNDNLNSLKFLNIKTPVAKISDKTFLETLKKNEIYSHTIFQKEIDNINDENYDSVFAFSKKDKNFLINFKQKTLPNFINIFSKLNTSNEKDEALHFSEFFAASVGSDASKLNDLGFSIFVHSLFSHNFDRYFLEPIIQGIFTSENMTKSKRKILINDGSQFSNDLIYTLHGLTIIEQPNKKKKFP